MVDPGSPRSPRLVTEDLRTGAIPDKLPAILAARFQTVCKDGEALPSDKQSGWGIHLLLEQIALGVDHIPVLEWVTIVGVEPYKIPGENLVARCGAPPGLQSDIRAQEVPLESFRPTCIGAEGRTPGKIGPQPLRSTPHRGAPLENFGRQGLPVPMLDSTGGGGHTTCPLPPSYPPRPPLPTPHYTQGFL